MDVTTASFETWEPPGVEFDMVFAASAWHWLAPSTRYGKAASLLKPGSLLALVTGGHRSPKTSIHTSKLFRAVTTKLGRVMASGHRQRRKKFQTNVRQSKAAVCLSTFSSGATYGQSTIPPTATSIAQHLLGPHCHEQIEARSTVCRDQTAIQSATRWEGPKALPVNPPHCPSQELKNAGVLYPTLSKDPGARGARASRHCLGIGSESGEEVAELVFLHAQVGR